jgi:hypothetical protein
MWVVHSQQVQRFLIDTITSRALGPTRSLIQLINWSTFSRKLRDRILKLTADFCNAEVKNVDLLLHSVLRLYGMVIVVKYKSGKTDPAYL